MREILFRGKRMTDGKWVYGDYHKYTCTTSSITPTPTHYIMGTDIRFKAQIWVDPDTVGQYTGLTDKNGVKIFEGDIILVDEHTMYVVKFSLERMGFEPFAKGDGCGCCEVDTVRYEYQSIEVIGSLHNNTELFSKEDAKC